MSRLSFLLVAALAVLVAVFCAVLSVQTSIEVYQRSGPGMVALMWAMGFAVAIPLRMLVVWSAQRMHRASQGPHEVVMLTHKGWFGIVPVYLLETSDDGVTLEPRYRLPLVLVEAQAAIFNLVGSLTRSGDGFPIRVTGRLATPKAFRFKVQGPQDVPGMAS